MIDLGDTPAIGVPPAHATRRDDAERTLHAGKVGAGGDSIPDASEARPHGSEPQGVHWSAKHRRLCTIADSQMFHVKQGSVSLALHQLIADTGGALRSHKESWDNA